MASYRNADIFLAANLLLFTGWSLFAFTAARNGGSAVGSIAEFWIYAVGLLAVITLCWLLLRNRDCPAGVLILIEIGLVAHFAGAFVPVRGGRLYELELVGLRFDSYVHLLNAFAGAALLDWLLRGLRSPVPAHPLIVIGLVLGAGSVIETLEYFAFVTVLDAGVGGYANNMQDLLMNLIGASLFVLLSAAGKIRLSR